MSKFLTRAGGEPLPAIESGNCAPNWIIDHHVRLALASGLPELKHVQPAHRRAMVIVCAGPSLAETWPGLRDEGGDVWCCGGAHDFLIERKIIPYAWVACDPLPHIIRYLDHPHPSVRYCIASMCHPFVREKLSGHDITLWHSEVRADTEATLRELRGSGWTLIGGGSSVGTRALYLGHVLGYRRFIYYGFDGSARDGASHAMQSASTYAKPEVLQVNGESFEVNGNLIPQASDWRTILDSHRFDIEAVHGDGINSAMWRAMRH